MKEGTNQFTSEFETLWTGIEWVFASCFHAPLINLFFFSLSLSLSLSLSFFFSFLFSLFLSLFLLTFYSFSFTFSINLLFETNLIPIWFPYNLDIRPFSLSSNIPERFKLPSSPLAQYLSPYFYWTSSAALLLYYYRHISKISMEYHPALMFFRSSFSYGTHYLFSLHFPLFNFLTHSFTPTTFPISNIFQFTPIQKLSKIISPTIFSLFLSGEKISLSNFWLKTAFDSIPSLTIHFITLSLSLSLSFHP